VTTVQMTVEQLRQIAEEQIDLWNAQDVDGILARLTDDVVWSTPAKTTQGKAAAADDIRKTFTAFPDLRFDATAVEVYFNSDATAVVSTWSATGTMTGPLLGVPPTGRRGTLTGMTLSRFTGDKIREYRITYDGLLYLQQLGLLPPSDSIAFKALVMGDVMVGKARQAVQQQIQRRRSAVR
jgi:steroid delta-isomerase-like uncharacterized protein